MFRPDDNQSTAGADSRAVCVWRFLDGRAGHRNQVLGLTEALGRMVPIVCQDIDVSQMLNGVRCLLPRPLNMLRRYRLPDFLIGAGHATHLPLLAAATWFGGKSIVLMKPSLPLALFDLCLVPAADGLRKIPPNVMLTEGAINRIRPGSARIPDRGLVLIGGPSRHFGWSDSDVLRQVQSVIEASPAVEWTISTSRRTPATFLSAWQASGCRGRLVPVEQTNSEWLPAQLTTMANVWVTNESVSMIFEALTAGAAVGILQLSPSRDSRVTRCVDSLISRKLVTPFNLFHVRLPAPIAGGLFNEAERCAEMIARRYRIEIPDQELTRRRSA
ncbi:MAG: ELM1/GtrOC1 family putative glycosyltransferase [Planctomycetaceae bacterium]